MKRKESIGLVLVIICSLIISISSSSACTIYTVVDQERVFFGNNEDHTDPNTYIWFEPRNDTINGGVYLGYDNFIPQGGMNDKGLAFDTNSIPSLPLTSRYPQVVQNEWAVTYIMKNCANVSQVIDLIPKLYWGTEIWYQVHFADANGDAVVIHPGTNRELNITRMSFPSSYLISTNFNVGNNDGSYPCKRYETTQEMLTVEQTTNSSISIENCFDILNATHAESAHVNTLYSNVFDLKQRIIYLTYWHQYEEIIELDLTEELAIGEHEYLIKSLFSEDIQTKALIEYTSYQEANSSSLQSVSVDFSSSLVWIFSLLILTAGYVRIRRK